MSTVVFRVDCLSSMLIRSNILTEGNIRNLVNVVDEQMDDVAGNERKRLETIQSELADVRGRLDRLYDLVETTTEFNMADFAHRIRDHKERQERLESAAEGARAILAQRRAVLDDVKTITAYAKDMSRFLQKSELTERRAFIETFVKEIELLPDNAVVRYSVPMPDDSLIPGKKVQEIPLNGSVVSSVKASPPCSPIPARPLPAAPAKPGRSPLLKDHAGTALLWTNSGSSRLSNCSSLSRTRGRLSWIVPELSGSLRGLAYPFR